MTTQYEYILDTGAISADTSDIITDVEGEFQTALGQNINTDASTPQGTLITAEVLARTNVMKNNAELGSVINPNQAYGVFLDAICALMAITRGQNSYTSGVNVPVTGDNETTIPAGSRVKTDAGDIFATSADVTIGSSLTAVVNIVAQSAGAIPLAEGTLTILDGTIGWGGVTVDGTTVVTLGTTSLTDGKLKNKRNLQLAKQGVGSSAAILAAVTAVANVTSAQVVENNTGEAGVVNGITFTKPSGMWVCVAGTPDLPTLSQALYDAHGGGCPWDYGASGMGVPIDSPNGMTATDPATGLNYNVLATTPVLYDAYVMITVKQTSSVSSPANAVQNAIVDYSLGEEDGELGLIVGASVSAYEMAGAVARQLPGMYVKSCSVACVLHGAAAPAESAYVQEYELLPYQQALLPIGNINVTLAS